MSTTSFGRADAALRSLSDRIADAIAARDVETLRALLAPGFVHRTHGGEKAESEAFLASIKDIPGEIAFVRLEALRVDECPTGALVTGIQHAQVVVDQQVFDDRRGFIDWFVTIDGEWRLQAAVDLPA